jgi:hypothetical protein
LATVPGQVGDYIDLEAPHQVNSKTDQSPVTQRGGTRKVQIVARTEMPGTSKLKVRDAGNLAQTAPEAGDSGTPLDPCFGLPTTSLSLAESVDNPYTIATVTLDDIADYEEVGADVELQYLVQEATPASTDEGDTFGPLLSSTGEDEIDAPAVLAGQTIWVRGRPFISSTGQLCSWSTWISLTLGPDDEGEGGELPAFTLALSIDVDGVLSAEATSTVAEITSVYFLAGAVGGAAPAYADVLLETPDASGPPFTAASLATMEEGETRTVGAIGEDDLGNRTVLVLASITRAVNTGSGAGTPGNWSHAFVTEAGGTYVLGEHDDAAEPLEAGLYRRVLLPGSYLRGQATVDVAGALTAYLDVEYSLDDGSTWEPDPIGIRVPLKFAKHAVGFATLVPDDAEGDVLLRAVVAGGNATAVPEIRNFIIESIAGGTPPPLDGEDEPVDPETPGDYPEGGPLGTIIHRWHAGTLIGVVADGGAVASNLLDIAGQLPPGDGDGYPDAGNGQSSPTFRLTGGVGGLPCVEFDGSNDGLTMDTEITGDSFSLYALITEMTTPGSNYGIVMNGNVFPNGKGWLIESSGAFNVYINTTVPVPTNVVMTDDWDKTDVHLYRWVFSRGAGTMWFYVDGVQKGTISDGNLTVTTLATKLFVGVQSGQQPVGMKVMEFVTWDAAHNGATGDPVEAAILAAWGL